MEYGDDPWTNIQVVRPIDLKSNVYNNIHGSCLMLVTMSWVTSTLARTSCPAKIHDGLYSFYARNHESVQC